MKCQRLFRYLFAGSSLSVGFLLCSCNTIKGPDYERPGVSQGASDGWNKTGDLPVASKVIQPLWWTGFNDPTLDGLIADTINGNYDLRVLASQVNEADAIAGLSRAERLPTVTGSGSGTFSRQRAESGAISNSENYSVGARVNWEIDIWGKKRRDVLAAESRVQATEADYRAGYLSVVSKVASNYFSLRQLQEQIEIQEQAIEDAEAALAIYRSQLGEGIQSSDKVLQQESEVATRKRALADRIRRKELSQLTIGTLLGKPAGSIEIKKSIPIEDITPLEIPANLPSDLLWRRPDILAAEYRLLEAHFKIESANLARLPTLSLTANGGFVNQALSNLLQTWTLGLTPTLNIPIFDPKISANIRISKAEYQTLSDKYIRQILKALEEVEKALVNIQGYRKQYEESQKKAVSSRAARANIRARLEEGLVSQLEVFEAERTAIEAEEELFLDLRNLLVATVDLYKALGGGWEPETVSKTALN